MTSLLHLLTFVEVAAAGSFAAAARSLSLPRSTVTARIKALEDALGIALFRRTTRQVQLTAEGETYLERVRPALADLEAAGDDARAALQPTGAIRVSVPVDLSPQWIADLVVGFQEIYPKVSFEVDVSDRTVDLVSERFDLALRGRKVASQGLVIRKIAENEVVLVARAADLGPGRLDGFKSGQNVLDPLGVADDFVNTGTVAPPLKVRNLELAKSYVLNSCWAAFLPRSVCEPDLADGTLVEVSGVPLPAPVPLFAVLPSGRFVPRRVRLFLDHLIQHMN